MGRNKNFDGWNTAKKATNAREKAPYYHEREIWWCTVGLNIGSEQDGSSAEFRRPVLILKGLSARTCLIAPLTTSIKEHPLRLPIGMVEGEEARAILSQIRVIDTKRLVRKIGYLDKEVFADIRKAVKGML